MEKFAESLFRNLLLKIAFHVLHSISISNYLNLYFQSYAQSTIKEMLGWYGLQDSSSISTNMYDKPASTSAPPGPDRGQEGPDTQTDREPEDNSIHEGELRIHLKEEQYLNKLNGPVVEENSANHGVGSSNGNASTVTQRNPPGPLECGMDFKDKVSRWDGLTLNGIAAQSLPFEGEFCLFSTTSIVSLCMRGVLAPGSLQS